MSTYRATHSRRQRSIYAERKKLGMCVTCNKKEAIEGQVKCGDCKEKSRKSGRDWYRNRASYAKKVER